MSYFNNYNTTFNSTNYYTTLGDFTNMYVDLGTVYVDLSYNQTINGVKTYLNAPMTNYPTMNYQLTNKQYIDDTFDIINIKLTIPIVNNNSTNLLQTVNTGTKKSITPFQNFSTIRRNKIVARLDVPAMVDTHYTFGVSKPAMWLAGGASQFGGNSIAYSYDGLNWTGVASTDISGVRTLCYNGTVYVAGCTIGGAAVNPFDSGTLYNGGYGARTTLAYSFNGINWTPNFYAMNIFSQAVNCIAWNGTIFVAGGFGGNSLGYSYDGIRWTGSVLTGITMTVACGVSWNGSMWAATGTGTTLFAYSYDGIRWQNAGGVNTIFNTGTAGIAQIGNCIAYDGIKWLAGGTAVNQTQTMCYSNNGQLWTNIGDAKISTTITAIAWNGLMWISVGGGSYTIAYSYDGFNWTGIANSNSIFAGTFARCIAWNGYMWLAGGGANTTNNSTLAYSYNGLFWIPLARDIFGMACNAIIWTGRKENIIYFPQNRTLLLGSGTNGQMYYTPPMLPLQGLSDVAWTVGFVSALSNGENSFNSGSVFSQSANGAAWNGYKWIAVGTPTNTTYYGAGNTMASSTIIGNTVLGNAGNVWIGMANRVFGLSGTNIGWNGNVWAATGQGGNSLAWSSDGCSWFGLGTGIFTNFGQTIAWNGQYWLAGGSGTGNTMAFSYDGLQWTGLGNNIFNIQCNGLAWNGSIWVAVGYGSLNTLAYSQDGFNWTGLGKNTFSVQGNDIASNASGTMWVAGGAGGNIIANSSDGINWIKPTTSITGTVCNSITHNGKYWLALGLFTIGSSCTTAWSWDGLNWNNLGAGLFTGYGMRAIWNQGLGTNIIKPNYIVKSNQNTTAPLTIFFGAKSTLYYSSNGVVWNSKVQSFNYDTVVGIAYNGRIWVASINAPQGGSLYSFIYSYDGINWTFSNTKINDNVGAVVTNGTIFIAGSLLQNIVYYSYDGINWLIGTNYSPTTPLNVFIWNANNHFWIGMGGTGAWTTVANGASGVAYSVDGIYWLQMLNCNLTNFVCKNIAWNGTQFVAVGAPTINTQPSTWASYDGQRWERAGMTNPIGTLASPDTFSNTSTGFSLAKANTGRSVAWNGKIWVACGTGLTNGSNTSIIYSNDGVLWFNVAFNDVFGPTGTGNNIFWNGFMWLCNGLSSTGSSQLAYSYNGHNWFISTYNNNGTILLTNNNTSTFQSNTLTNINKVQLNFNGPSQSKTLDIVSDNYYNPGYNRMTFNC